MLISFLIAFLQRALSGTANAFGYLKEKYALYAISIMMILLPILIKPIHPMWFFHLFMVVNFVSITMKVLSFSDKNIGWVSKYKDIHLWENFVTGGFFLFMLLTAHNVIMLLCAVYPALILHKGFINLGNHLPFFSEKTDDPTGKTYYIPLLKIKIKRSSTKLRIALAIISIIVATIVMWEGITISLHLL